MFIIVENKMIKESHMAGKPDILSVDDIKRGYQLNPKDGSFSCLVCHASYKAGEVYPFEKNLYLPEKAVQVHLVREHGDRLTWLLASDRRIRFTVSRTRWNASQ